MASLQLLPPPGLNCQLTDHVWSSVYIQHLPPFMAPLDSSPAISRRDFLNRASVLACLACISPISRASGPLVFSSPGVQSPTDLGDTPPSEQRALEAPSLNLGQIPADFWLKPRELWLKRQDTGEEIRAVYWQDGKIIPAGYWKICAILRDARQNVMTSIDPGILDVLRGVLGYYHAWNWLRPIIITSGFRTAASNKLLEREGASRNSMHLYGKAVDLYIAGIPPKDIGLLGLYLRHGGVGFYPTKGFTHLDTGNMRTWRG